MLKTKKQNKKKKGFTLIELIVVLAVLAIIALIAIPNFNQIRENSKKKADERSCELIDKAVQTLIQEDDGVPIDGKYLYNGVKMSASADTTRNIAEHGGTTPDIVTFGDSITELKGVLGEIKNGPQETGKLSFQIIIKGVGGSAPTVKTTTTTTAVAGEGI